MKLENLYQTLIYNPIILIYVFLGYDHNSQQYIDFVDTYTFEAVFLRT